MERGSLRSEVWPRAGLQQGKISTSSAVALCLRQSSCKPGAEQFQRECEGLGRPQRVRGDIRGPQRDLAVAHCVMVEEEELR